MWVVLIEFSDSFRKLNISKYTTWIIPAFNLGKWLFTCLKVMKTFMRITENPHISDIYQLKNYKVVQLLALMNAYYGKKHMTSRVYIVANCIIVN